MNPLDMLKQSKCFTCRYKLTRVIEPVTKEDREYYLEVLDLDDADAYDLIIEQHKCLKTDEDLDGVIRECSAYSPKYSNRLIREYKF